MRLRNKKWTNNYLKKHSELLFNLADLKSLVTIFELPHPLFLEIGTGKGHFLITQALKNPLHNYLGIEKEASILAVAVKKAVTLLAPTLSQTTNLRFGQIYAEQLNDVLAPQSLQGIFLNFSDPWPKNRHAKKRLTHQDFLNRYAIFLQPKGVIELKTDNANFFHFSMKQFENHPHFKILVVSQNLYADPQLCQENVATEYEKKFHSAGQPIYKLVAQKL